jgi:hypothetical protein
MANGILRNGILDKEEERNAFAKKAMKDVDQMKEEDQVIFSKEMTALRDEIDGQWEQNVAVGPPSRTSRRNLTFSYTETRRTISCSTRNQGENASSQRATWFNRRAVLVLPTRLEV